MILIKYYFLMVFTRIFNFKLKKNLYSPFFKKCCYLVKKKKFPLKICLLIMDYEQFIENSIKRVGNCNFCSYKFKCWMRRHVED
jgi:hypothetical protein